MRKIFLNFALLIILNGCAESMALLGPASTAVGGGNIMQSSFSAAVSYGVEKKTGKSPVEHAIEFAEKNNPKKEKKPCVSFLESTSTELCAVLKNKLTDVRSRIKYQSKIKRLDK